VVTGWPARDGARVDEGSREEGGEDGREAGLDTASKVASSRIILRIARPPRAAPTAYRGASRHASAQRAVTRIALDQGDWVPSLRCAATRTRNCASAAGAVITLRRPVPALSAVQGPSGVAGVKLTWIA
jgi:hypothetical protein